MGRSKGEGGMSHTVQRLEARECRRHRVVPVNQRSTTEPCNPHDADGSRRPVETVKNIDEAKCWENTECTFPISE